MIGGNDALALDALRSKDEIRDAILRVCRGVDRCDEELILSGYHPDAQEDHGYLKGPAATIAAELVRLKRTGVAFMSHLLTNIRVEIDGPDLAHAETYVTALQRPAGQSTLQVFVGRYADRFERRDGSWRIAHRTVVHDWSFDEDLSGRASSLPVELFARGTRDREDPTYRR